MVELYKGQPGSPITYLASDISATQTTISVSDDSALPDAPNICTIGYGENIETIKYGVKSNGVLQEVVRGIEGTPQPWAKGTEVARFFTAYDHNSIVQNMLIANDFESVGTLGSKANELIQNNEDIKLDIDNIAYKDLEGITRLLGWGIIVESGENENGSYIKFGDGTMICWVKMIVTDQTIDNPYGSLFQATRRWCYPKPFVYKPVVNCSQFLWGTSASWGSVNNAEPTYAVLRGIDPISRPSGTQVRISAIAIGKWK